MKKLVFVVPSLSSGGSERVVSVLANKISDKNYDVTIICLLKDMHTYYTNENVKVIFIKSDIKNRLKRNIYKFKMFVAYLKDINPDVVISFTYDCSMITAVATRFIKTKLIISERNDPNNDPSSKLLRKLRNRIYKLGNGYVFQTKDAQNYYCDKIRKKSIIIGNPLNGNIPEPYKGKRNNRIVCVSRLAPQKNIKLLIDSYKKRIDDLKDYTVEIYGDGPLKHELEEYILFNNLSSKIKLKGYSKNIYKDIYDSSIFVMPSNYEGLSNSMIEAMALGIPVISTDHPIGGAKAYIKNNINGILVEVDNVDEMSEKMVQLAKNKKLCENISKKSIEIREILKTDKIVNKWIAFINKVEKNDVY